MKYRGMTATTYLLIGALCGLSAALPQTVLSDLSMKVLETGQSVGVNDLPKPTKAPNDGLDDLISSVFGDGNNNNNQLIQTPAGQAGSDTNLDQLISDVFKPNDNFGTPGNTGGGAVGNDRVSDRNTPGDCECVPYYQCQNGTILENGIGLIDIRIQGPCENYLDICCKPPDVRGPNDKITPKPPLRKGCGQRNPEGVGFRITGQTDNEAQFGEFPWVVAILKEQIVNNDKVNVYQCSGALIHPQAVLTAAHCVNGKSPSELKIRVGEWDTQTKNEIFPHQDRDVRSVIVHEKFHSGALYNNVALLLLSSPVEIAENVDVVCLPEPNDIFDGSRCFASGWGKDIFGQKGRYQVILKKVELPVVPHDTCQDALRTTRLGKHFVLDETFICAGGEPGKDTCKGDGGGALVCPLRNRPNQYAQAGVVSWGIGCGEAGIPGVYANVAAERAWIDEKMAYNNLDMTTYQY